MKGFGVLGGGFTLGVREERPWRRYVTAAQLDTLVVPGPPILGHPTKIVWTFFAAFGILIMILPLLPGGGGGAGIHGSGNEVSLHLLPRSRVYSPHQFFLHPPPVFNPFILL